jgi:tetratricopeptide (TPR) repeat protein
MSSIHKPQNRREIRESKLGGPVAAAERYARRAAKLMGMRRFRHSVVLLRRAIELNADSPKPYVYQAVCELRLSHGHEARKMMMGLARCAVRIQRVEGVSAYVERKLLAHPGLRQIYYLELVELDRTDAAPFIRLAEISRLKKAWPDVQHHLWQAFLTKTREEEVLVRLRELFVEMDWKEQLTHLDRYQEGKLSRSDLKALVTGGGATAVSNNEVQQVEPNLRELIGHLESELNLESRKDLDDVGPLVREFTARAEKIVRDDSKARIDLALAFFEMGLHVAARDQLKEIPPENARYLESQCLLAEILLSEGKDLDALAIYQRCQHSDAPAAIRCEAEYRLIDIYMRLGDVGQALIHFRSLQRHQPDYRNIRDLRNRLEMMLGTSVEVGQSIAPLKLARK